jgi:hypothetical protein
MEKIRTPQYFEQFGELDYVCTLLFELKDFLSKNVHSSDNFFKTVTVEKIFRTFQCQ